MEFLNNVEKLEALKNQIADYPNFPKEGILFRDIFSVFKDAKALKLLQELLLDHVRSLNKPIDVVAALESRGFLLGPLIALNLNAAFVPIRKAGKLPGAVRKADYNLEYGTDSFEIQADSIRKGQNVLVVDDLLATGGSLEAASKLLNSVGASIVEHLVIIELADLNGRKKLSDPVFSLVQY